jgi:hypothetical protein
VTVKGYKKCSLVDEMDEREDEKKMEILAVHMKV